MVPTYTTALIFGAGNGLAASLARRFARAGLQLALAVRHTARLASLVAETGAVAIRTDAADVGSVVRLFADVEPNIGAPALVVYNAGFRSRAPVTDLDPADVQKSLMVSAFRCIPSGAAGGSAHASRSAQGDLADGRFGGREGLSPLRTLRHGQVRVARTGPEPGPRTAFAGRARRPLRHRRGYPLGALPGAGGKTRQPP